MSNNTVKSNQYEVFVKKEWCKGCRFCVEFCPQHILYETGETNSNGYHIVEMVDDGKCLGCEMCTMVCPEFAIHVVTNDKEATREEK